MFDSTQKMDLKAQLEQEATLPANLFTLSREGLREGLELVLNMPRPHEFGMFPPHILVGDKTLDRNKKYGRGCLYRHGGRPNIGIARRAVLETITPEGKQPFDVLNRPESDEVGTILMVVDFKLELPRGAKLKRPVLQGCSTSTAKVLREGSADALVSFERDGDSVEVMYADGFVHRITRHDASLKSEALSDVEMLAVRVEYTARTFREHEHDNDHGTKLRNAALFGLIHLLGFSIRQEVRDKILDFLREHRQKHGLSKHATEVVHDYLVKCNDPQATEFAVYVPSYGSGMRFGKEDARKGPPAEERARKAAKAEASREQYAKKHGNGNSKKKEGGQKPKRPKVRHITTLTSLADLGKHLPTSQQAA